jgi:hypothetical protein
MKVSFETLTPQKTSIKTNILNTRQSIPFTPLNYSPIKLQNYNQVDKSLVSFKSKGANEIDINKMEENKKELEKIKNDAQAKLNKADSFEWWKERNKAEENAESEIQRKDLSWYNPFQKKAIKEKWMNDYYRRSNEVDSIKSRRNEYEQIIKTCSISLEDSDNKIEVAKKLKNAKVAQDALISMLKAEGGLNSRIAGYSLERDQIERMFVEPLAKSKDNPNVKIPPAILLHGATGTGKTTFLNGIAEQSKDYIRIIDMSNDTDAGTFIKDFRKELEKARLEYLRENEKGERNGKRTILLINEAERVLGMSPTYAKSMLDFAMDEEDIATLEKYNNKEDDTISLFKSMLDHCSEVPKDKDDKLRGALTVFITTNYPHLIHPDLISRDGKLPYIAINPARGVNIEEVVKHYARKASNVLDSIKSVSDIESIDGIAGISKPAKEKLKELKKAEKLDTLKIDYENIPYDKIAKVNNPNAKDGAYSNDRYRLISEKAFMRYLENPETSYQTHFAFTIAEEKRDIGPKRYNKFVKIYDMLAPLELGERDKMIKAELMGCLDDSARNRLEYIRVQEKLKRDELSKKEENNTITEEQKQELAQLRELEIEDEKIKSLSNEDEI